MGLQAHETQNTLILAFRPGLFRNGPPVGAQ
jgi:hypothetical protein